MVDILFFDKRSEGDTGKKYLKKYDANGCRKYEVEKKCPKNHDPKQCSEAGGELIDFVRLIEKIKKDPDTKLYLAANDTDPKTTRVINDLVKVDNLVAVTWPDKDETNLLYYPLASGAGESEKSGWSGIRPGAAYFIYRELCEKRDSKKWGLPHCPKRERFDEKFELPMQIFWGINAPKLNWEQYNLGVFCVGQEKSSWLRAWNFFAETFTDTIDITRENCPYSQFFREQDFMDSEFVTTQPTP
jgi:hypothetical protein